MSNLLGHLAGRLQSHDALSMARPSVGFQAMWSARARMGRLEWAESEEGDDDGGGELREPLGHAGAARPVTIFVPPTVLEKEQAVFDLPMRADGAQQLLGGDRVGIEAGEKIACVGGSQRTVRVDHVPINTQRNLRVGEVQWLTKVTGVVQVEPQLAAIEEIPFF